jgi:glycosyltransferase involved in cell wall biosynthesis
MQELAALPQNRRRALSASARAHVVEQFGLQRVLDDYARFYHDLVGSIA